MLTACRRDSSIERVQQRQPVAGNRSRPDRHQGLQALGNSVRLRGFVSGVQGF
jgi:hypothetical protein